MFISLYDRNFRTISTNSTINVDNYKIIKRAYDLNEFSAVCGSILLTAEPMFAILKTNEGDSYYDLLAPLIIREDNGISRIIGRDLFSIFNTECVVDFTTKQTSAKNLIEHIFDTWQAFDISGFNVKIDVNSVTTTDAVYQPSDKNIYNIKDLFSKSMKNYGLFYEGKINLQTRTLDFTIKTQTEQVRKIRLEDFNVNNFEKYQPAINTAIGMDTELTIRHNWYLLQNNAITTLSALRDIFPTNTKIFIADDVNQADFEAVSGLAENRFQESIIINIVYDYDRLKDVGFNTSFEIYYQNKYYKTLPIGEIIDDGTKNKILKIGNLPIDFIQII